MTPPPFSLIFFGQPPSKAIFLACPPPPPIPSHNGPPCAIVMCFCRRDIQTHSIGAPEPTRNLKLNEKDRGKTSYSWSCTGKNVLYEDWNVPLRSCFPGLRLILPIFSRCCRLTCSVCLDILIPNVFFPCWWRRNFQPSLFLLWYFPFRPYQRHVEAHV